MLGLGGSTSGNSSPDPIRVLKSPSPSATFLSPGHVRASAEPMPFTASGGSTQYFTYMTQRRARDQQLTAAEK